MSSEAIRCGKKVIGWITRTECDNYWTIASFKPGDDYNLFKDTLEATIEDDDELEALEAVNELKLVLGESQKPIRDFQMTSADVVEFKEQPWV